MRIDNRAHLITAARRRHEFTRSKTIQALRGTRQRGRRGDLPNRRQQCGGIPILALHPARHPS